MRLPAWIRRCHPKAPREAAGVDPDAPPADAPRCCWRGSSPATLPWPPCIPSPPARCSVEGCQKSGPAPNGGIAGAARCLPVWLSEPLILCVDMIHPHTNAPPGERSSSV